MKISLKNSRVIFVLVSVFLLSPTAVFATCTKSSLRYLGVTRPKAFADNELQTYLQNGVASVTPTTDALTRKGIARDLVRRAVHLISTGEAAQLSGQAKHELWLRMAQIIRQTAYTGRDIEDVSTFKRQSDFQGITWVSLWGPENLPIDRHQIYIHTGPAGHFIVIRHSDGIVFRGYNVKVPKYLIEWIDTSSPMQWSLELREGVTYLVVKQGDKQVGAYEVEQLGAKPQ